MRRLEVLYRRLGRPEKALLALLAIFGALRLSGASAGSMAAAIVAVYIAGIWVLVRWARLGIRKAVWRLRNRLIVAYLFIALVPVSLILVLVNIGLNILTGQMAAYLVISEIERSGGLALRGGELYFGARPAAPVTGDEVAGLAPHLGEVSLLPRFSRPRAPRLPPRYNLLDRSVLWPAPVRVAGASEPWILVIHTRPSALLRAVFAGGVNWGEGILVTFTVVAAGFLVVELVCFFIGFSLSRTVTGAVHELYLGTHKVKDGDFAHRIQVRGADQLAELGVSFNRMTENLGRLLAVEKEKERLQAEISIAREVQSRLFPRAVPRLETLQIAGACQPARSVSGDYYDILAVEESSLCLALGDVAGKGISAALLMASIQSIMRTQLSLGQPKRAFAGAPSGSWNGMGRISTAEMVSQLNRQLYASTSPEKYATFFFGLYEEASGLLTYTNAGHPPPVLLRRGEPERLEVTGTVVGAFPRAGYDERSLTLAPGDLLVAFTDGVTEAENEYGRMFGEERLIELLARHGSEELQGLIRRVMESVAGWAGAAEPQDDMTLLAARRI